MELFGLYPIFVILVFLDIIHNFFTFRNSYMTTSFLLIVQIVLVVVLTIAVLLQKSSSIGLGAYSGSNESVFGAKGPASFLAKTTFILGFLFVVNTITLGYMYSSEKSTSVVDNMVESTNIVAPSAIAAPLMDTNSTK